LHNHYQQNFTANHTGLMSGFGVFAGIGETFRTARVLIKVGGGDSWQTDGWSAVINPRLDGTPVDLTPFNLRANAGDNIVFDIGLSYGNAWMVVHGLGPLYTKNNNSDSPSLRSTDRSLAFTTWMIPDAVVPDESTPPKALPAPGAGVLMLLGLAMLGLARGLSGFRTR
jgi:hypothetical protein